MNSFAEMFSSINQWYWFALALVLVILEVMLGTSFFLLWIGVSAAAIGVILLVSPGLAWEFQFLIFAVLSLACLIYWNFHLKHQVNTSDSPNLNRRTQQYIGRVVTLREPIVNGRGKIQIDDSSWRVEGEDLPIGTAVKVVGVDGVVLKVEKV